VRLAQAAPPAEFFGQRFGFEQFQRQQGRGDADARLPEWLQRQVAGGSCITRQSQATFLLAEHQFAQFVIADDRQQAAAKRVAQFSQTFGRALKGRFIHHAHVGAIAAVIAVGNNEVGTSGVGNEPIQEVVVGPRLTQPDPMLLLLHQPAAERIPDAMDECVTSRRFSRTAVMDVADDGDVKWIRQAHGGANSK
jgi:hypothetical protein